MEKPFFPWSIMESLNLAEDYLVNLQLDVLLPDYFQGIPDEQ
jgi:hypothetical protein